MAIAAWQLAFSSAKRYRDRTTASAGICRTRARFGIGHCLSSRPARRRRFSCRSSRNIVVAARSGAHRQLRCRGRGRRAGGPRSGDRQRFPSPANRASSRWPTAGKPRLRHARLKRASSACCSRGLRGAGDAFLARSTTARRPISRHRSCRQRVRSEIPTKSVEETERRARGSSFEKTNIRLPLQNRTLPLSDCDRAETC